MSSSRALARMDDDTLFDRQHRSLHAFYRELVVPGSADARLLDLDGLTAAVVPATPDRSVCNGVVSDGAQALGSALGELATAYAQAGIRAWTVWIPARDREAAALLGRAGHRLDGEPIAMAMELERFEREPARGIEIGPATAPELGRINDIAYGYDGDFQRALGALPPETAHMYAVRLDGEACACTVALDHEGDCYIGFVATLPHARGRGLATELITRALHEARLRGCETTSLQATTMGAPVYARLGYRDLGRLHMWERREAA